MKARVHNRHSRRAIALGLVAAAVFAGGAQAATEQASGDALNALKVRSEGLNLVYGLGGDAQADAIQALTIRSEGMNDLYGSGADAIRALAIRSQGMNDLYGPGAEAVEALTIRSQAMNQLYGAGSPSIVSEGDAVRALTIRSEAMNDLYGASSRTSGPVADTSFDWVDAGVAVGFGAILLAGAAVLLVRRQRRLVQTQL